MGTGTLLIGTPVTATLTASPTTLAPGNGVVTSTLAVGASSGGPSVDTLTLVNAVTFTGGGNNAAISGNTAYLCGAQAIGVYNVSNPASPALLTTFGASDLSGGGGNCQFMNGTDLVDLTGTSGNNRSLVIYDVSNPSSPNKLGGPSAISPGDGIQPFIGAMAISGTTAFFTTDWFEYYTCCDQIFQQVGDTFAFDLSNPASPAFLSAIQPTDSSPHFGIAIPNSSTLLFGSTSITGGATTGAAKVNVVNISNPSTLSVSHSVSIPQSSWAQAITTQGTLAMVGGITTGWNNPGPSYDPTGNLTLTALDITTPSSPNVISTAVTTISTRQVLGVAGLGVNQFAVAIAPPSTNTTGPGEILFVDASNPASLNYSTATTVPGLGGISYSQGYLYATTATGMNIYQVTVPIINYTATVQVPNTGKIIYNPSSFSVAPAITPGSGSDTLTWTNPASNTISWTSNVTGIAPADVLPAALGGSVSFTTQLGSGTITLPAVNINSGQILGISPAAQTVAPAQSATYTITATNPTSSQTTYSLAASGINPAWVTLPASVTVAANSSANVTLNLRSALADLAGTYGFTVTAAAGGVSGSVQGALVLAGPASIGSTVSSNTLGVSVSLTPASNTGGQGTPALYNVQLTNAGNVSDTYALSLSGPNGFSSSFGAAAITVPPGLTNPRQTTLQITAPQGTPAAAANFMVKATSQTNSQISGSATGTLNVSPVGVSVSLSPASVNPGGTFQMTVRNLGTSTNTFTLALGGAAAVIARLPATSVTLGGGQSQTIAIAVGQVPFAPQGALGLVATAASGGVTGAASGTVTVPATQSVSAVFNPVTTVLNAPGAAVLTLEVQNTGTTLDSYVATIASTSGPIQATITDITGQPVQTTSVFLLPGVTFGQFTLNTRLTGSATGTVTVKITSQSNSSITATATGQVTVGSDVPVAVPGKNRNVPAGKYTSLDGGESYDPDQNQLSYAWSIVTKPAGSALNTLGNATSPQPYFLPDVSGVYTLQLIVNNGASASTPAAVQVTAYSSSVPPNANAGKAASARRGSVTTLNGSVEQRPQRYEPDSVVPVDRSDRARGKLARRAEHRKHRDAIVYAGCGRRVHDRAHGVRRVRLSDRHGGDRRLRPQRASERGGGTKSPNPDRHAGHGRWQRIERSR